METPANIRAGSLERAIGGMLPREQLYHWMAQYAQQYDELMAYYRCAMMEVETKFRVLNEEFSLKYDANPIENVKCRLKSPESLFEKMNKKGLPFTTQAIEENINDVAGIRVICSFCSEIYTLAETLLKQDDVTLIERKDYIANPKPNGYRSLHLIIGIPIFLHDRKRLMRVEIQLRTLAMDLWASTEHRIRYKKTTALTAQDQAQLKACAEMCAALDSTLKEIRSDSQEG